MEAKAIAKTVRVTPRKARLVLDLIRGKSVGDAYAVLRLTPKAACEPVAKVLLSAVANAEGDKITGSTENNLAGALSLVVERVEFAETGANSDYLVPTDLTADEEGINAVLQIIEQLKQGIAPDVIIAQGADEKIVQKAVDLL